MFNFFNEIVNDFGLEGQAVNSFNIINMSNKLVYMEGHKGIVSISATEIAIKVKNGVVIVSGADLKIKRITSKTLAISGKIKQMESV